MRPSDIVSISYSVVCFSLLHIQHSMASLTPQTHFCDSGICSGLPVRWRSLDPEEAIPTPTVHITLPLNSTVFLDRLLDTAPCPPVQRVHLICGGTWSAKINSLTCEERTHILSRCVESVPIGDICGSIRKCQLNCKALETLRDLFCSKHTSIPEVIPPISVIKSAIMTSQSYNVTAANATDWSTTSQEGDVIADDTNDGRLSGEVVIILITVCVFGFVFLPLIVYFLLNRDNRSSISRCCSATWSCCTRGFWSWCKTKLCPTHERFNNEDHKKEEVVEEIAVITPLNSIELGASPGSTNTAGSFTNDSGIGFDLDFPEADAQTPDEYRNTPWIQRRSLLVDQDFDFDWSHL